MNFKFFKYQGAGNDFIMIDNRNVHFDKTNIRLINHLCDRRFGVGADGLIILEEGTGTDFSMFYANANGLEGSMCGNGGRCIVAFAKSLGIIADYATFSAIDGIHTAKIAGSQVALSMMPVKKIVEAEGHYISDTGSPHVVVFQEDLDEADVFNLGRLIRFAEPFKVSGVNVDFIELNDGRLHIRTYERGVEDETLACGTGVVAAALTLAYKEKRIGHQTQTVVARGGILEVRFDALADCSFSSIELTGPTQLIFEGIIDL